MRWRWMAIWSLAASVMGVGVSMAHAQAAGPKQIKVEIMSSTGKNVASATFKTVKQGVRLKISLHDLPFGMHAVHIHEHAVCDAPDFKGAGGHFNPDGKQHGFDNPMGHHNGDLPLGVDVGEDHMGSATFLLTRISLDPSAPDSLFANGGTSIVVHEHADDGKTDPSGNAGNRIACGVIQQHE